MSYSLRRAGSVATFRGGLRRTLTAVVSAVLVSGFLTIGPPAQAAPLGTIATLAGGGVDPGPTLATSTAMQPVDVAAAGGNVYVADSANSVVRKVNSAGSQVLVAGTGVAGYGGDQGAATAAPLNSPNGVAASSSGDVFIADTSNNRVRMVAAANGTRFGLSVTAGDIYTIAGTGTGGYSGDSGSGTSAMLDRPYGVAVDAAGNVFIADTYNNRVRVVAATNGTILGQSVTAGYIYTVAGSTSAGSGGDGGAATAAQLTRPQAVSVSASGNLFVTDTYNHKIRLVAAANGTLYGQTVTAGDIYTIAGTGSFGFSGDGGPATSAALNYPGGAVINSAGDVFIADKNNNRVRVVAASTGTIFGLAVTANYIYTLTGETYPSFSGDGGPVTASTVAYPEGVVTDNSGDLFIADTYNNRVRMVAAASGTLLGQTVTADYIYTGAGYGSEYGSAGDGGSAKAAQLNHPEGVAVDGAGDAFIADSENNRVRMVAGANHTVFGQNVTAGDIYTVAGNGADTFSGDGGSATAASVYYPAGVAVDSSGNLFIADANNNRVRMVAAANGTLFGQSVTAGDIYTIAGTGDFGYGGDGAVGTAAAIQYPTAVATDGSGNVFIADTDNDRVRVVAAANGTILGQSVTAGYIYTVAGTGTNGYSGDGGAATAANVNSPYGVAVDPSGDVFVSDTGNDRVRMIAAATGTIFGRSVTAGYIYTLAGTGTGGYSGDGGTASTAQLNSPIGVAVHASGDVFIADNGNDRVRMVAASSGLLNGQSVTAGDIYLVAGNGTNGYAGDGGPATGAALDRPAGVAVNTSTGTLLIGDTGNNRVRIVYGVIPSSPPSAPALGVPTPGDGTVTLTWTAPTTNGGSPITGYDIYQATTEGGENYTSPVQTAAATDTGATISGLTNGTLYYFTVKATNAVGPSPASNEVSATPSAGPTVPSAPTLSSPTSGDASVTLWWTAPSSDGGSPITGYKVYDATTSGGQNYSSPAGTAGADATGKTITGLTNGTTYYFTVAATNAVGEGAPSNQVTATPAFVASPATGTIDTFAGGGVYPGPSPATNTAMNPFGVAFADGHLYISDQTNNVIRQVDSAGSQVLFAGNGTSGFSGDGGAATAAQLDVPSGVAVDATGDVFIADVNNNRVRVVAAANGTIFGQAVTAGHIYTVAGTGFYGYGGDSGPATGAQLKYPTGIAIDSAGNLLIADTYDNRVRVVAAADGTIFGRSVTANFIYTIAGTGTAGYGGDGSTATSAQLNHPFGIAVDANGNAVIADTNNHRVRVVPAANGTFYGQAMTTGFIYTIAGTGTAGYGGDGSTATSAQLNYPYGVAVDANGDVIVADTVNSRVRVVAAANGTLYGQAVSAGSIYTLVGNGTYGYAGDGGTATAANLASPQGVTVDTSGNLFIADSSNLRVRVVAAASGDLFGQNMTADYIYTIAGTGSSRGFTGDGGPATTAQLAFPTAVATDTSGNVFIADSDNFRVRVVAGADGTIFGHSVTRGGIYTIAGNGTNGYSGDGGLATSAEMDDPAGVAVDSAGNLFISDLYNERVRVVAASDGTLFGQTVTAGHIYTVAGDGTQGSGGDGGIATAAQLGSPTGLAVDSAGNLFISDASENRVRVVAAADGTILGHSVTANFIYTVAGDGTAGYGGDGTAATSAQMDNPGSVAVDSSGNLFIADEYNNRVRMVAAANGSLFGQAVTADYIYTIAGDGTFDFGGDGGIATAAMLRSPSGVAVDSSGNVFVADSSNDRVRMVAAVSGSMNYRTVTVGHIYLVAGNGNTGFTGDGGPAVTAELSYPPGVAVDSSGRVFIVDANDNRVRVVNGTIPVTPPLAPVMGTPTPGNGSVTLSWTEPTDNGGSAITGYNIYLATTQGGEDYQSPYYGLDASTTSITIDSLNNGDTYYFTVKAINSDGPGQPSDEVSAVPTSTATAPGAPTLDSATGDNGSVTLSWTAPTDNGGSDITEYRVYQGTYAGGEDYTTPAAIVSPSDSGTTISGLDNGTEYFFTVKAVNNEGASEASNEMSATPATAPGAPTMGSATTGDGSVTLSWTAPTDNGGSAVTEYRVYQGTSSNGEDYNTAVDTLGPTATGTTISGLDNGTEYFFTVTAVNDAGESVPSNEVSATPATVPAAPTMNGPTAGNGTVTLSWTAPTDNGGSAITGFNVYQGTTSGGESTTAVATLGPTATGTTISGLTNGTEYFFTVTATNVKGESGASNEVSATPNPGATVPSAPTASLDTVGAGSITVAWTAPTNNGGSPITGYNVYQGLRSGRESYSTAVATAGPTDTSATINGLTNGTTYYFTVTALNAEGQSVASNEVSAIAGPPLAPTRLSVSGGRGKVPSPITVTWVDRGSLISTHEVKVYEYTRTKAGSFYTEVQDLTGILGTSTTLSGLVTGTSYVVTVSATNPAGTTTSGYSKVFRG